MGRKRARRLPGQQGTWCRLRNRTALPGTRRPGESGFSCWRRPALPFPLALDSADSGPASSCSPHARPPPCPGLTCPSLHNSTCPKIASHVRAGERQRLDPRRQRAARRAGRRRHRVTRVTHPGRYKNLWGTRRPQTPNPGPRLFSLSSGRHGAQRRRVAAGVEGLGEGGGRPRRPWAGNPHQVKGRDPCPPTHAPETGAQGAAWGRPVGRTPTRCPPGC